MTTEKDTETTRHIERRFENNVTSNKLYYMLRDLFDSEEFKNISSLTIIERRIKHVLTSAFSDVKNKDVNIYIYDMYNNKRTILSFFSNILQRLNHKTIKASGLFGEVHTKVIIIVITE